MGTVNYGLWRMNRIRAFIAQFPYSRTSVLQRHFFDFPSGKRKCRQVLQGMVKKQMLNRCKYGPEYVYFRGQRSGQWVHTCDVTAFHWDLCFSLRKPQEVVYYKREVEYPGGRADALYYIKLEGNGSGIKFFLEYDDGKNYFGKFEQYEEYARSRTWILKEFWADPLKSGRPSFPVILVVSDREIKRPESELLRVKMCKPKSDYLGVLLSG
ncbi:MAG: hypothetical protein PHW65_06395 [Dehalococcoidales bacterium]|nr:hypothetical protein [Dehalococcoidales bacterium]